MISKIIKLLGRPSETCSECPRVVLPDDPYYATPCGTFCAEHMREHVKECAVCRVQFGFVQEDRDER